MAGPVDAAGFLGIVPAVRPILIMKRLSHIVASLLLTACLTAPVVFAGAAKKDTKPAKIAHGAKVDIKEHLVAGKTTIVDFTSEYCPPCRYFSPLLDELHAAREDLAVVKVDINRPDVRGIDWDSPVVAQYGIRRRCRSRHGREVARPGPAAIVGFLARTPGALQGSPVTPGADPGACSARWWLRPGWPAWRRTLEGAIAVAQARVFASANPVARLVQVDRCTHTLGEHEPAWPRFRVDIGPFLR